MLIAKPLHTRLGKGYEGLLFYHFKYLPIAVGGRNAYQINSRWQVKVYFNVALVFVGLRPNLLPG